MDINGRQKDADAHDFFADELRLVEFHDVRDAAVGGGKQGGGVAVAAAFGVAEEPDHDADQRQRDEREEPAERQRQRRCGEGTGEQGQQQFVPAVFGHAAQAH